MSPVNDKVARKFTAEQLGLLSIEEMIRRKALSPEYFVPGKIYKARKTLSSFRKALDSDGRRKRIKIERGDYLLCVTCEKYDRENAVIEFFYKEVLIHYKTDGQALSCVLDTVELEENE